MQRIITLAERKATEAARRRVAVAPLLPALADYAGTHGGRFLLFGSAARRAANETPQFRTVAAHAYDSFDHTRATRAVDSAVLLVSLLPPEVAAFRQAIDP